MAGFVSRGKNREWSSSNWVFWGFMDHVLEALSGSPDVAHRAEGCKWNQMLSFEIIGEEDSDIAGIILDTCRVVAQKCMNGELLCKVDGRILDDESQTQFREAMQELVVVLAS